MDLLNVPKRYIPKILSTRDTKKQKQYLRKSRKLYKKGIYYERPKVKSFKSKPSPHLKNAEKIYKIDKISPSAELAKKTQCSEEALEKIVNKGRGAYYSSGSRPNQTAESWGIARLASAISGGNASIVDYDILSDGCKPTSKALKMANRTCKKQNKCKKYFKGGATMKKHKVTKKGKNIGKKLKKGGSGKKTNQKEKKRIYRLPSDYPTSETSAFSIFRPISNNDIERGELNREFNNIIPKISAASLDELDLESGSMTPIKPYVSPIVNNGDISNLTPSPYSQLSRNTSTPVFHKVDSSVFIPGQQKIEENIVNSEDEEEPEDISYEEKNYKEYIMNYLSKKQDLPPLNYKDYIKERLIPENGIRYAKYGIQLYTLPNTGRVYDEYGKIYTEEDINNLRKRYEIRHFTDPAKLTLHNDVLGVYVNKKDPSLSNNEYDINGNILISKEHYDELVHASAEKIRERIRENNRKNKYNNIFNLPTPPPP